MSLGEWFVTSGSLRRLLDPEDEDATFILNVGNFMRNSTVSHPRRLGSSTSLL